jgi:hypothetical protein
MRALEEAKRREKRRLASCLTCSAGEPTSEERKVVGLPSFSLRFHRRSRPLRAHATPVSQQPERAIHLMCRSRSTAKTPTPARQGTHDPRRAIMRAAFRS